MRYAPGVTLSKWRRQFPDGRVPLRLALEVARQVAAALDYAHGEKIVHRDVKPGNIMVETVESASAAGRQGVASRSGESQLVTRHPSLVTSTIRVRLLDFGLAAEIRSSMSRVSTETGDTSGTRPYMAPEQWLGRKQDGRTDQYALACVLYEMLSGAPPFAGVFETGDPAIMRTAVVSDAPEELEDVPAAVNAALLRALAKDRVARFSTCAEFVAALGGLETPQPRKTTLAKRDGGLQPAERQTATLDAVSEADVLRRKLTLSRAVKAIPAEDRADAELAKIVGNAEDELALAEEACILGRFATAAENLNEAQKALHALTAAKAARDVREEAVRKSHEEAERKAREEAERKAAAGMGSQAGDRKLIRVGFQDVPLRWCPPGTFTMGSPSSEEGHESDETQHQVTLTRGFWMGETEVTQGLWKKVMGGNNPSGFKSGDNYPVEWVSWNDCQEFLNAMNRTSPVAGFEWRLPTEAQWEYACRAGRTGAYGGTGRLDDMGWYDSNSGNKTHPVAKKRQNAWGFFDMHGNVWEWCADWYGSYPEGAVTDPLGSTSGSFRVYRGGSWNYCARRCRSAVRNSGVPDGRLIYLGFRVALVPVQ